MTELNEAMRKLELPARIKRLPVSPKGYPVPWFVAYLLRDGDGGFDEVPRQVEGAEPDFRVVGSGKIQKAHRERRCWVCGDYMGAHLAFTIGPMCAVNRISSEPPAHRECAIFSATACPFLTKPRMKRNEAGLEDLGETQDVGIAIKRNPGVALVWITRGYKVVRSGPGVLFRVGDPDEVLWFAEGRTATRAEIMHSIDTGLPILRKQAERDGPRALPELEGMLQRALELVPA